MIETKRLIITEAIDSEIDRIIEIETHKDNRDFIWIGTVEEHKAEIRDKNHLLYVMREKGEAEIIGYALVRLDFKSEIYELRRIAITKKGMGYGRESMEALLKNAFEERNINRFWLDVYPDNVIGIKLYESLGMHRDGILRQNYKSARGYLDQIIYSMLKEEYFEQTEKTGKRISMICDLKNMEHMNDDTDEKRFCLKKISEQDIEKIGNAMFYAYLNTVDQVENNVEEAITEVRHIIKDGYGPFLKEYSYYIEVEGKAASVLMVSLYEGTPMITEIFTGKEYYGKGMAGTLIKKACGELKKAGYPEFLLYVKSENTDAIRLYEKIGFRKKC